MVERTLCMCEAPGSIPGISTNFCKWFLEFLKHFLSFNTHNSVLQFYRSNFSKNRMNLGIIRGCSSVVERTLCMCEAPGSIPGISTNILKVLFIIFKTCLHFQLIKKILAAMQINPLDLASVQLA